MALTGVAAALLRRRAPRAAVAVAAFPAVCSLAIFWRPPGPVGVLVSMWAFLFLLRALDARVTRRDGSSLDHALYCLWLRTHPSEDRPAPRRKAWLVRGLRGAILCSITVALVALGRHLRPWQRHPLADDALSAIEVATGLMGVVDIFTFLAWRFGIRTFLVDGLDPRFPLAPSLGAFWATRWNRPAAGVLRRGIYVPCGGRRAPLRGVLLVFLASGLMHAAPILLGGTDRVLWAWLAAGTLAFFVLHAAGVIVEGALGRHGRHGILGRAILVGVFAVSVPLYPAPLAIVLGLHGRPPGTASVLAIPRALGLAVGRL